MTAAAPPSVTDNARARMRRVLEDQFWPFLAHDPHDPERFWGMAVDAVLLAAGRAETTTEHEHDWKRQQNVTSKGYAMPPIEVCRIEGCDAARSAETTTATTEDAARVLRDEWMQHGPEVTWLHMAQALAAAGLLARPTPSRDQIAKMLNHHLTEQDHETGCALRCGYAGDNRDEHLADAVLDLLKGGTDE